MKVTYKKVKTSAPILEVFIKSNIVSSDVTVEYIWASMSAVKPVKHQIAFYIIRMLNGLSVILLDAEARFEFCTL